MSMIRLDLSRPARKRVAALIVALNLIFIGGMAAFLYYWPSREYFGPRGRWAMDHVLVQFHLGAENVVAAWYSSMLLLLVALACLAAYALDGKSLPEETGTVPVSVLFAENAAKTGKVPVFRLRQGWLLLAAAFAGLSLDEIGSLHERIGMVVALNRASLTPDSTQAVGWVYLLAVPIGAVALLMLVFGWVRFRRAPAAFALLTVGVLLYVSDPFLELLEQTLQPGTLGMLAERVLEEGVAELGGTTCVLMGIVLYAARTGATHRPIFALPGRCLRLIAGLILLAGIPATEMLVAQLPAGDVGIPANWFPAAAWFLLAIGWMTTRRAWGIAAIAIVASAYFGAGLFGYAGWYAAIGYPRVLVDAVVTGIAVLGWLIPGTRHSAHRAGHHALSTAH
jgi:hypothetical protein